MNITDPVARHGHSLAGHPAAEGDIRQDSLRLEGGWLFRHSALDGLLVLLSLSLVWRRMILDVKSPRKRSDARCSRRPTLSSSGTTSSCLSKTGCELRANHTTTSQDRY